MSRDSIGHRVAALGMALIFTAISLLCWTLIGLNEIGRDCWVLAAIFYFMWRAR